jgi:hypothetical protein
MKTLTGLAICAVIAVAVAGSLVLFPAADKTAAEETNVNQLASDPDNIECGSEIPEICEAVAFVEITRGRAFKSFPVIEIIDESEFHERLSIDWATFDELEPDTDFEAWQVLGLVDRDVRPGEDFLPGSTAGVLGVYLSDEEELWVRAGDLSLFAQSVLVHELTHAHDDQWFDLERLDYAMVTSDRVSSIGAAIEGNAMRVEDLWRASLSEADQDTVSDQEFNSLTPEELAELQAYPEVLIAVQAWPYREGLSFVEWVAEEGGEDAVDEMLNRPPLTTEQVFHADAWIDRERARFPSAPKIEYEAKGEGMLGELVLSLLLGQDAAEGWGGDAFVLYEHDDQRCVALSLVADSDGDLDEMATAAQRWVEQSGLAEATTQKDPGRVTLTGCLEVDL